MDAMDVKTITIPISSSPVGGTIIYPILKAPGSTLGGGIAILAAELIPATSNNAGTGWAATLINGGTLGTVIGGTIATKLGGTAAALVETANTIYPFTIITTANINFLSAGQYLAVQFTQEGTTKQPDGLLVVQYLNGR